MAYQENLSVANVGQLFSLLKSFLLGTSWVLDSETISTSGPALAMHKGGMFFNLSISAGLLTSTVSKAFGSGVTANVAGDSWSGAFTSVWFFSDPSKDYVHVVASKGAGDYYHFSVGKIDNLGMTGSTYYSTAQLWNTAANLNRTFQNFPAFVNQFACVVPSGILNTSFAPSGDLSTNTVRPMLSLYRVSHDSFPFFGSGGLSGLIKVLDYVVDLTNSNTTGGVHLHSIPATPIFNTYDHNLGIFPDVRLCSITGISDGQEVINSGDTWKIFPMMKRGLRSSLESGLLPINDVNSVNLGFAYKKT
jgi:hypothetical protein